MTQLVHDAALCCVVLGLLSSLVVAVRARQVRLPLAVLLDFLLAAGLLRLNASATPTALATAAVVIVVRKLAMTSIAQRPRPSRRAAVPSTADREPPPAHHGARRSPRG